MLVVERRYLFYRIKDIYFCEDPFDVDGCDSVAFFNCKNGMDGGDFNRLEAITSIIDLTRDLDAIWADMDKKSTQYEIRRAEREGCSIQVNKHFDEFYRLNQSLQRNKGITPSLGTGISLPCMKSYGTLFTAENGGEMLGGHLYLEDARHIRLWFSASRRLDVDRETAALIGRANRRLHWEAMKYARAKGIAEFDWGGLWPEAVAAEDTLKRNINSFKRSFGGVTVTGCNYSKAYSRLLRLARQSYHLSSHVLKPSG